MRSNFCHFLAVLSVILVGGLPTEVRAVDPLSDAAVTSLAQLTDPHRLERLSDEAFRAQLGPALGWLHVARRRDVAPESVITRAFALNGLVGERARLTREALLRNLARADSWELFAHDDTALALSVGHPAQIPTGIHRGHLAQAAVIVPDGLTNSEGRREFACLVLRADDEMPYVPPARRRQVGDLLAGHGGSRRSSGTGIRPAAHLPLPRPRADIAAAPALDLTPIVYDEPLPPQ